MKFMDFETRLVPRRLPCLCLNVSSRGIVGSLAPEGDID